MDKNKQNINSENINSNPSWWKIDISKELENIKENIKTKVDFSNNLLSYIDTFEKSGFFKNETLKAWDTLFDEWSIDGYLYIVKSWSLSVEKYIDNKRQLTKHLATIEAWWFVWEWALNDLNTKKEALIKAISEVKLVKIEASKWIKAFIEQYPDIWYNMLRQIIIENNKRLIESNKIITINDEVLTKIRGIEEVNISNLFRLMDSIVWITNLDYLLYLEKHQVLDNIFVLKYDSRESWKLLNIVFEKKHNFIDLDDLFKKANVWKYDEIHMKKLSVWDEIYGYFMMCRHEWWFSESDKKIFASIRWSFAGLLKKFFTDKDEQNKKYLFNSID